MQNQSMPPVSIGGASAMPTDNVPLSPQKVSLNPFAHLKKGVSAVFKTNPGSLLVAILISSVTSIAFIPFILTEDGSSGLTTMLVKYLAIGIVGALLGGYFSSVVTRFIITGSRGQKESLGHAFSFVFKRLPTIILTYLFILAVFFVGGLVLGVFGQIAPIVAVLLGIIAVIAAIVFLLRVSYVPLILVDDNETGGPMDIIRRSAALWKKSGGPLIVYILSWLIIYIVFQVFIGDSSDSKYMYSETNKPLLGSSALIGAGIGITLLYSIISNIFGALAYSGEASIYNDVRQIVDGNSSQSSTGATGPVPPAVNGVSSTAPTPPPQTPVA